MHRNNPFRDEDESVSVVALPPLVRVSAINIFAYVELMARAAGTPSHLGNALDGFALPKANRFSEKGSIEAILD